MRTQWISRAKAAEILGVHPQTISNYADSGVIHQRKRRGFCFYPLSEIEALAECPERFTTEEVMANIQRLETEMQEKFTITKEDYEARRHEFYLFFNGKHRWQNYKRVVDTLFEAVFRDYLTEREAQVIQELMDGYTCDDIARFYDLTRGRIHSIIQKALRKLLRVPDEYKEAIASRDHTIEELKSEVARLNYELARKEDPTAFLPVPDGIERFFVSKPFCDKIADYGISVRAYNCLKAADIVTIGDLVSYTRADLMKFRNFGRKSLNELDLLLEKMHLEFGMWRDPKRKY